jgi:DNA invertase Pin-like site-specific DNA recombinase
MVSPEIQTHEIERFCEQRGWTIVGRYSDIDLSGRTTERPGLQQLLRDATKATCDAVVFYRIDRLSREEADFHAILASLRRAGIHVDSVGNPNDGTAESALLWSISAALAKYESVRLGKRISDSHRELARRGRWHGGPVPFGWRRVRDEDGPRLEVAEEEAHWRRWMHERYAEGASCHEIATRLNQETTIRPRSGGWWTNSIIRVMLAAPVQIGARESDGELVRGGNIEPLLSEDVYQRTLALLPARSRRRGRSSVFAVPTALFVCGNCGGSLSIYHAHGRPHFYCRSVARGLCDRGVSIDAAAAVTVVEAAVLSRVQKRRPGKPRERHAVPLKAREAGVVLSRARETAARLSVMYASGEMIEAEYRDAVRLARERVEVAEAALRATEQATEREAGREALAGLHAELHRVTPDVWTRLSVPARRQIVNLFIASVTVSPGRFPAVERCAITWHR